jgi:putative tryptophan/tyrosine transport system substrate-binding protein
MRLKLLALLLVNVILASSHLAEAQQPTKIPRIGVVISGAHTDSNPRIDAFRHGLRDLGYIESKDIVVEYRYAEGKNERFPKLVAELVQLKVDLVVVTALPAIRAAKRATATIPIVMITTTDPVATGMVESLTRPGGNITGVARLTRELNGKRLELLKEAVPRISHVGVLWDANGLALDIAFKEYEAGARALKIHLQSLEVRGPNPIWMGHFKLRPRSA